MNEGLGGKRILKGKDDKKGRWEMGWGGAVSAPAESESYLALMSKGSQNPCLLFSTHPQMD